MATVTLNNLGNTCEGSLRPALDGRNPDIVDGELLVLVGSSRCGESTALMCDGILQQVGSPDVIHLHLDCQGYYADEEAVHTALGVLEITSSVADGTICIERFFSHSTLTAGNMAGTAVTCEKLHFLILLTGSHCQRAPTDCARGRNAPASRPTRTHNDNTIMKTLIHGLGLAGPISVAILEGVWMWNEFFIPLTAAFTPEVQTMPVGILSFIGVYSKEWCLVLASVVISTLSVVLACLLMTLKFHSGIMAGADK